MLTVRGGNEAAVAAPAKEAASIANVSFIFENGFSVVWPSSNVEALEDC